MMQMDPNQEELYNLFRSYADGVHIGKDETESISGFIRDARVDVEAARSLYRDGIYSRAVFNLAQATEKATKAYLIASGNLSPKEAKELVGHDPLKGHLLLAERMEKFIILFKRMAPSLPTDLSRAKHLDKNPKQIETIDYESILKLLQFNDRLVSTMSPHYANLRRFLLHPDYAREQLISLGKMDLIEATYDPEYARIISPLSRMCHFF
jgi:hypothetical protein